MLFFLFSLTFIFFFKQKTAYEMRISDWSSDVCSSDLRERFQKLLNKLGLRQPPNRTARTEGEALAHAAEIGYPLVVRPSYVLGGRAMEIVHEQQDLERYMREAVKVSNDSPVLLDHFLNRSEEHTSELQSLMRISYAVFCLKKNN